ncbi:MAG TPA: hypothetical protein VFJ16_01920 [Longimicrobium sp.]|nr:hypothetical protein [Longimicrobium sp.]
MSESTPVPSPDLLPAPPHHRPVGLALFTEMTGEDEQFVLDFWRTLRRVEALAAGAPVDRPVACAHAGPLAGAHTDAELAAALLAMAAWAEERGYLRASAACAELAATLAEDDPHPSILAGRLGRRLADYDRAEAWYVRGAALARSARAWEQYVQALLWHGFLHFQKGEHALAERRYRSAGRAATRYGRRALAGVAHHNLLTIASDLGRFEAGARHAARALALYPVHYPRVPHLVHDYGFLLARNGYFSAALPLFEAVYPHIPAPHERIVVAGNIARAAGGARVPRRFQEAADEVCALAGAAEENASRGLLGLAEGAHSLGYLPRAVLFAERAAEVALRRGDHEVVKLAAAVAERARAGAGAPADRGRLAAHVGIARECIDRLRRWAGRPRGQAVNMLRRHLPRQPAPAETAASTGWRRPAL